MVSNHQHLSLRADYLLRTTGSETIDADAEVRYSTTGISEINAAPLSTGARYGSTTTLLMPPLANAHDHGRGVKTLAYGVSDAPVEAWVPATYTLPPVDPYLVAAAAFSRMARSGIGYAVHCHLSRDVRGLVREAQAASRAAKDVGIRIAFVVPLRDGLRQGYGAGVRLPDPPGIDEKDSRSLQRLASADEQLAAVAEISDLCEAPTFQVQYGPIGVEWCSDTLLEGIAQGSMESGRRVHMHLLESRYQREWADHAFPQGMMRHLDDIGLLSSRLTIAHGTWLRPDECELLASRGVTVSINTSSNLRLRSGIAPLAHICQAGLKFAVGLDALAIDDDDDVLREMRLLRLLHGGRGFEEGVSRMAVLDAACRQGAYAAGCDGMGAIAVGAPADLLLLDLKKESQDTPAQLLDVPTLLHARATASSVHTLVINGRCVVENGRVTGVDEAALQAQLRGQLDAHAASLASFAPNLRQFQQALADFYLGGRHCTW